MGDAGFYRGTSSEQDSRFTDKERKLLKQMRFDGTLDEKICMERVNLEVLKPWITAKLIEILGVEDDVLVEYVFSQLEEKSLNPKVMQINLTGFLNAKRAREFMGELWTMLIEASSSSDGIPASLVEKKMKEIQDRAKSITLSANGVNDAAGSDWKNRYDSLTGGKYGQRDIPSRRKEDVKRDDDRRRDNRDLDTDNSRRDQNRNREVRRSREREIDEGDRRREREDRSRRDERRFDEKDRRQSHSPARRYTSDDRAERRKVRSPPRRRFTERKDESQRDQELNSSHRKKKHDSESSSSENEKSKRKKKKKRSRKHSGDSDAERVEKKKKKRKKEKKHKKRHSSESD